MAAFNVHYLPDIQYIKDGRAVGVGGWLGVSDIQI